MYSTLIFVPWLLSIVTAQLTGSVGPLTSASSKASKKTCNVLNYGAKADQSTDLGPALSSAFQDCIGGGLILVPAGNYALNTWVTTSGGKGIALQIDGIIYRTGQAGGNMIYIEHASDVEVFSSTGKGAFQGNGYQFHLNGDLTGPRILRFYDVDHFSVHDLALTDSPSFHLTLDTCTNAELYSLAIRGGDHGGLDGIDIWSNNVWVHDVEVTNKDECVTVKSPAHNILIEDIYCNWSGGCAFGSLGANTDISDVTYRNVYTWYSNQMMMFKSNGGSGTVSNVLMENFIGHGNAYSLYINGYWSSMSPAAGNGVNYQNITFRNWKGTEANGAQRGPINVICPDGAPCTGITIDDFAMWTESGSTQVYKCESAYGQGFCLRSGSGGAYGPTTSTVSSAPAGYSAPTMAADIQDSFGYTVPIPIPTIPTSFFPGIAPISKRANGSGGSGVTTTTTTTTRATTTTTTTASGGGSTGSGGTAAHWGQCGGQGWTGPTTCESPYQCVEQNEWYSQCL